MEVRSEIQKIALEHQGRYGYRRMTSPSAVAGSARPTTSPSIGYPAQAVLGCVEDILVRVEEATCLGHS